jgi:hypothetical protein
MQESRTLRLACKAAKIEPPIQFRQLRTTYGSLLLNADAPLSTISELLGHKDTRMTRRHYAHLLSERLQETVDEELPTFSYLTAAFTRQGPLVRPQYRPAKIKYLAISHETSTA